MDKDNVKTGTGALAQAVETHYNSGFGKKFPYEDCYKLQRENPPLTDGLVPDLDMYFSFVAGYSCNANSLGDRPLEELRNAIPKLKKSFFDAYPRYKPLTEFITAANTPALYLRLQAADDLRRDLVTIMEKLV
jgi:YxiJ-like protein